MEGKSFLKVVSLTSIAEDLDKPYPCQLAEFLPWACKQCSFEFDVAVRVRQQDEYMANSGRSRRRNSLTKSEKFSQIEEFFSGLVLTAFYDNSLQLCQITFERGSIVPGQLIKLLSLIAKFYPYLSSLVFLASINQSTLYELSCLLENSQISDICLDGTYVQEGNYHCLLQGSTRLRNLSLARCSINDVVVESLMSILSGREGAATTLLLLNLSSNFISDQGATFIGKMLGRNRKLCYLNLAGNRITDKGVVSILNVLVDFPMTEDDLLCARRQKMTFLKEKDKCIAKFLSNQSARLEYERVIKRKTPRKSKMPVEVDVMKNAEAFAREALGVHEEKIVKIENGVPYAFGNNVLAYLNLSFNDLTYIALKNILKTVETQSSYNRIPIGLFNICLNGNHLPNCTELMKIEEILQSRQIESFSTKPSRKSPK